MNGKQLRPAVVALPTMPLAVTPIHALAPEMMPSAGDDGVCGLARRRPATANGAGKLQTMAILHAQLHAVRLPKLPDRSYNFQGPGHPGEIVLNQAQQGKVANGLGGVTLNHAPVYNINGTGLSPEQLGVVLDQHTKRERRQIGHVLADWQRRHG